ncbi:DUF6221 family protein [Actinomadura sp. NPDC049382]|uniref:DUF6221 family protein n=1 Tax=Actinomadura sp. NPDC049382 TaxID=3158220 RepID=UPI00341E056A
MSSPSEIVAFLRARLDEDEQAARDTAYSPAAAIEDSWSVRQQDRRDDMSWALYSQGKYLKVTELNEADARHIARHDPARVLEDVKSKRSIVDAYVKWSALPQAKIADHKDGFAAGLLAAVEALAATYSDHPDYEPGWRQ